VRTTSAAQARGAAPQCPALEEDDVHAGLGQVKRGAVPITPPPTITTSADAGAMNRDADLNRS
jgi:hypothetical protein